MKLSMYQMVFSLHATFIVSIGKKIHGCVQGKIVWCEECGAKCQFREKSYRKRRSS